MKKINALLCTLFLLLGCMGQVFAYNKLVVFGDSLSDLGFQDNLGPLIQKSPLWTSPGGKAWPFYLSHNLGLATIGVNNSTAANKQNRFVSTLGMGDDYAAGGAATDGQGIGSSTYVPPSIYQQINRYLEKHAGDDKSQTLYVLWGGSNDIFLGLSASDPSVAAMSAAIKAADNISNYVRILMAHGASHVIVINLPDLGNTPFAQKQQGGLPALLTAVSDGFNQELVAQLAERAQIFDIHSLFNTLIEKKEITINGVTTYFNNVTDPSCQYDPDKGITSISALNCTPPDRANEVYLFEDGLHPTDTGHQVVAASLADWLS